MVAVIPEKHLFPKLPSVSEITTEVMKDAMVTREMASRDWLKLIGLCFRA